MNMAVADRLQEIGEYYFSQKLAHIAELNKVGETIINLGIGSPDLPPHPDVIQVLHEESAKPTAHAYQSYKGAEALRNAFAQFYNRWYGVTLNPATEILPLIGSKEGIVHICMTYLNEGDVALIPNPGYPTYSSAVKLAGGIPQAYHLTQKNDWQIDFEELQATVDASAGRVKLLWANYPHMPTGQQASAETFEKLVAFGRKNNILICHDNPYSFILNNSPQSLLRIDGAMEVCIELASLSKSHNMAGWRVGVLCGAKERIDEILRFKSNMDSGMFLPVQLAAAKALGLGDDWFTALNQTYRQRREKVYELLNVLGCSFTKNQVGLFVWAGLPPGYDSGYALSDAVLASAKVFLTPGGIFGSEGDAFIRIGLCATETVIDAAISRIKSHHLNGKP